jgi:hypothetical protein
VRLVDCRSAVVQRTDQFRIIAQRWGYRLWGDRQKLMPQALPCEPSYAWMQVLQAWFAFMHQTLRTRLTAPAVVGQLGREVSNCLHCQAATGAARCLAALPAT